MNIFGRNADTEPDPRFHVVADDNNDLAVYDSHTGRFAPFYGDTANMVTADLNQGLEQADRFIWKDSL